MGVFNGVEGAGAPPPNNVSDVPRIVCGLHDCFMITSRKIYFLSNRGLGNPVASPVVFLLRELFYACAETQKLGDRPRVVDFLFYSYIYRIWFVYQLRWGLGA